MKEQFISGPRGESGSKEKMDYLNDTWRISFTRSTTRSFLLLS